MHMPAVDMNKQPMNIVFRLRDQLPHHLEHVRRTRRLTMDPTLPESGLSGKYGLFGSLEWWNNIALGRMPLLRLSGKVEGCRPSDAGRESLQVVEIRAVDGSLHAVEVHGAPASAMAGFQVGQMVSVLCALDELKGPADGAGEGDVARIALEMAVAFAPAADHLGLPVVAGGANVPVGAGSTPRAPGG